MPDKEANCLENGQLLDVISGTAYYYGLMNVHVTCTSSFIEKDDEIPYFKL